MIHLLYYMELLKEKNTEAGKTAEGLRIRQKKIKKKYKKSIDKSEQVCYNGIIRKAEPSESIKKESGKLGTISKHKERIQNVYKV